MIDIASLSPAELIELDRALQRARERAWQDKQRAAFHSLRSMR